MIKDMHWFATGVIGEKADNIAYFIEDCGDIYIPSHVNICVKWGETDPSYTFQSEIPNTVGSLFLAIDEIANPFDLDALWITDEEGSIDTSETEDWVVFQDFIDNSWTQKELEEREEDE